MHAVNQSRQGVLAPASENLAPANFTLIAAKAKLAAAKNLKIKGQVEQLEPTRIFAATKLSGLDSLEHKTRGYKRGSNNHFKGGGGRRRLEPIFRERNT